MRDSQIEALNKIEEYLGSDSQEQALIAMPTGTGKTAIMALISQMHFSNKSTLYITTAGSVRTQLYNEVSSDLWAKLNISKPGKECIRLYPSKFEINDTATDYFMTIQGLIQMSSNEELFNKLKDRIDLIIFDEGHKEPAIVSAKLIRSFEKKMVVFTATPQRNDTRKFNIDERYKYHFPIIEAITKRVVEPVEFKSSESTLDSFEFLDQVIEYMSSCPPNTKCIIKCKNFKEVKNTVQYLSEKVDKESILGIHHAVKKSDGDLYRTNVPDKLAHIKVRYLVHQNKLIEGIDDNNIKTLVLMNDNINVRELVQQLGRIIRKTDDEQVKRVVFSKGKNSEEQWKNFLGYDKIFSERQLNNKELLIDSNKYMKAIIEQYQEYIYSSSKSLKKINFEEYAEKRLENIENSFKVKLQMNIFEKINNEDELFFEEIKSSIIDNNTYIICEYKDKTQLVLIYVHFKPSELLINDFFLDHKLEVFILNMYDNYIFVNDSRNTNVLNFTNNYQPIKSDVMNNILSENSILNEYTVKNAGPVNSSYKSMSISGENLERLSKDKNNKFKILNTVKVTTRDRIDYNESFYLGYKKGRVSEGSNYEVLRNYLKWTKKVHLNLSEKKSNKITPNFAREVKLEKTELIYIIFDLDLEVIEHKLDSSVENLVSLEFEVENNMFDWTIGENEYQIKLEYDKENRKYKFIYNGELDILADVEFLLNYMNKNQSFMGILSDTQHRYMSGKFYKIGYSNEDRIDPNILDEIKGNTIKGNTIKGNTIKITEKGASYRNTEIDRDDIKLLNDWEENSLFGHISRCGNKLPDSRLKKILEDSEVIVCVDLGNEIADFITLSQKQKQVNFIHCKAGKHNLSASIFQEVCGQINKNLDYFFAYKNEVPDAFKGGKNKWKNDAHKVYRSRIIKNDLNLDEQNFFSLSKREGTEVFENEFWNLLKSIQVKPGSETNVIAFLGDAFSISEYERNKSNGDKQAKVIMPIEYIINSTQMNLLANNINFIISSIHRK
ncbi:DEAD/DEAH box helicase [Brochothrix thermosphacta]|uniref:DEAD/DEAH box helicase n=1 Tax=Brochothrix thermosphacta TaxID=2756 RepID=UPI003F9EA5CA